MPHPAPPPRPTRPATLGLAAALLTLVMPLQAAPLRAAPDVDDAGWAARPIRVAATRERDRALLRELPAGARLGYHSETGRVRFLSGSPREPLLPGTVALSADRGRLTPADARTRARRFVERYGGLFGLAAPARELRAGRVRHLGVLSVSAARARRAPSAGAPPADASSADASSAAPSSAVRVRGMTVRFEQVRAGVPVMGGEIVVQVSARGEIISAAGEVLPSAAEVALRPRLTAADAATVAATWLARQAGRPPATVSVRPEGLALYDPRIMGGALVAASGPRLAWRIDARLPETAQHQAQHRLVVVDARLGHVLTSIGRIYQVDRFVCDNRSAAGRSFRCSPPYTRSEGQTATGIADVDAAYRLMGVVDDYLASRFGRSGLDGRGARLKATVRYCSAYGCPWRNAEWKWAEQQAIFGTGWARADDIVAHEYTHGLLDHEVPLFYQYQSGAINESLADIFGELVDLAEPSGTDTAATAWRIGEDTPVGAFRDMQDPPRFGHADRVRSSLWHAGAADDGGVHRNSGVGNKAASLIADGGSFRGFSIRGIGRTRTARVYYQALTTRLTPAADYIDLADALVAACTDLAGSQGMTLAHCASVRDATKATQMHLTPLRGAPRRAPLCAPGQRVIDAFADDLEDPADGAWVSQRLAGSRKGWYYPQNPNNDPAWDATWASSGATNFYAPDHGIRSDSVMQTRSPILVPRRGFLRFEHGFGFDADGRGRYDGGIVEIRVDGGPWRGVKALFTHGGYNGRLARGHGNPLGGQRAFTGSSRGWSAARVDLSDFAGRWVKLRFRVASDRAVGGQGWYIDDIRVYGCARDDDKPTGTLLIDGGAAATSDPQVRLSLSYADATTWVSHLRVSGSAKVSAAGLLANGLSMPIRDSLPWDLSDRTFGGSGQAGRRLVYAQVRDAAGHWSDVFRDAIELRAAA